MKQIPVCILFLIPLLISAISGQSFPIKSNSNSTAKIAVEKWTILNKGKGGDSSYEMLNRIQEDIIQENPDLVFLSAGMNDMINLEKFVDYKTFEKNYQKIIDNLQKQDFELVLLNLVPVDTVAVKAWYRESLFREKPQDKIKKANEVIKELAQRNGLPLIDLYDAFVIENAKEAYSGKLIRNKRNSGTDDGVHLTQEGYQLVAKKLFDYLTEEKKVSGNKKIICFGDNLTYGLHMRGAGTSTGHTYPGLLAKLIKWEKLIPYFSVPFDFLDDFGDYPSPLTKADGSPITQLKDWETQRVKIREKWHGLLGEWPAPITNPSYEVLEETSYVSHMQQKIRFEWVPGQFTEGYLLIPHRSDDLAAVVTVYYEPETGIGQGKPNRDFALQLVNKGFVTLSLGTTESSENQTYSIYYPDIDSAAVQPLSMLAYAANTGWELLSNLPQVDSTRIGIMGHSYGGKWAMFASCLTDKFAAAVWSDPGIVFESNKPAVNYWEPWYLGYHPKPWRTRGMPTSDNPMHGLYPELLEKRLDLHELHVLMAPRPFFVSGGSEDPRERWIPLNHSIAVNRLYGLEHRVGMSNRPHHDPNEASNDIIYTFFEYFLQP
jgi:lysophospholipase L1-like esterase